MIFKLCPTVSVGLELLNVTVWLPVDVVVVVADPLTVAERVPQILVAEVSQTVIVALPDSKASTIILLLEAIPTETALELESLDMLYTPSPPEILTVWLPPTVRERLFWPKDNPEEPDALTVTEIVPQVLVFDVSQTVMVVVPDARPETVIVLPERLAEATLVLELLDIL